LSLEKKNSLKFSSIEKNKNIDRNKIIKILEDGRAYAYSIAESFYSTLRLMKKH
jgi:hypothetical protein